MKNFITCLKTIIEREREGGEERERGNGTSLEDFFREDPEHWGREWFLAVGAYQRSPRQKAATGSTWGRPIAAASDFFIFLLLVSETCFMIGSKVHNPMAAASLMRDTCRARSLLANFLVCASVCLSLTPVSYCHPLSQIWNHREVNPFAEQASLSELFLGMKGHY